MARALDFRTPNEFNPAELDLIKSEFFQDANRDLLLVRLRDHIHTLVGHFRRKIFGWDVVNEAINDAAVAANEEDQRSVAF